MDYIVEKIETITDIGVLQSLKSDFLTTYKTRIEEIISNEIDNCTDFWDSIKIEIILKKEDVTGENQKKLSLKSFDFLPKAINEMKDLFQLQTIRDYVQKFNDKKINKLFLEKSKEIFYIKIGTAENMEDMYIISICMMFSACGSTEDKKLVKTFNNKLVKISSIQIKNEKIFYSFKDKFENWIEDFGDENIQKMINELKKKLFPPIPSSNLCNEDDSDELPFPC